MSSPATLSSDQTAATLFLEDYYRAFSTLDVRAILPYFHEPCLIISPQGVFSAPTGAAVAAAIKPVMEDLRDKGFGRTELSLRQLKFLSPSTMLASGVAVRFRTGGQELNRAGVTYALTKSDSGWKIAVLITHDANEAALSE